MEGKCKSHDELNHKRKIKNQRRELALRQIIRDTINEMVKDVVNNTKKNLKVEKIKNIQDVYKSKIQLVNFSEKMLDFDYKIKSFLKENMYQHKTVLKKTRNGEKIIKSLFESIRRRPLKFIKKSSLKNQLKERSVCDFIAGMTDRYAINLYNSLK